MPNEYYYSNFIKTVNLYNIEADYVTLSHTYSVFITITVACFFQIYTSA